MNLPASSKNILIVTAYPVNNLTAGQGNMNMIADELIASGYSISLVCFSYPNHFIERPQRFKEVLYINQKRPQRFLYAMLFGFFFPLYTVRFSLRALKFIKKRAVGASLIYLDYSQVFLYALFLKKVRQKICMFAHDVIYQKYERVIQNKWYGPLILKYTKFTERTMFGHCDNIAVLSFKDQNIVKKEYGINAEVCILKKRFAITKPLNVPVNLSHFVFLGAWNRNENLDGLRWFIDEVFPLLHKGLSFTIVGAGIKDDFKNSLPPQFKVTGFVDDLNEILQSASALISPLFLGAGVKFKVLDAIKNGCRVIGTDISFEGIDISAPGFLLEANAAEAFAKHIEYCSHTVYYPAEIRGLLNQYINSFDDTLEWILKCAKAQN